MQESIIKITRFYDFSISLVNANLPYLMKLRVMLYVRLNIVNHLEGIFFGAHSLRKSIC